MNQKITTFYKLTRQEIEQLSSQNSVDVFQKIVDTYHTAMERLPGDTALVPSAPFCCTNDTVTFGHCGSEPLQWKVVKSSGSAALLICMNEDSTLPKFPLTAADTAVPWQDNPLRHWLNTEFLDRMFTRAERERIFETETESGVFDKIFLISFEELMKRLSYTSVFSYKVTFLAMYILNQE